MQVSAFVPRASNAAQADPPTGTVSLAVTAAIQQITLPNAPYATETIARFAVIGTGPVYWCYGNSASLSTSNGVPQLQNSVELYGIPRNVTQISVIAAATGSTLSVTIGDGQ